MPRRAYRAVSKSEARNGRHLELVDGDVDGPVPIPRYSSRYGEIKGARDRRVSLLRLAENVSRRGWVIRPHTHPHFAQMILVQSGGGSMRIEEEDRGFSAPAILIVPALAIHGFDYARDADGWVLTVSDVYLNEISSRAPEFYELFGRGRCVREITEKALSELSRAMEQIYKELSQPAWGQQIAAEAILLDIFVKVLRIIRTKKANGIQSRGLSQEIFKRFLELVEDRYKENLSVDDFAAELAITSGRLRAVCREVSDESPIRIINERIMLEARRYLAYTSRSIFEVSYELGFDDPSYFSRFFKSRSRETPLEFRERLRIHH